jgi:hypothetical protein
LGDPGYLIRYLRRHRLIKHPSLLPQHSPLLTSALDLLVCVYTCEQDRVFLDEFYRSVVGRYLLQLPNSQIFEVYADPFIGQSFHQINRLVLRAPEKYETLSLKTYEMIRYCVQHFQFRRLLKIDVTTVKKTFDPQYVGRKPIDLAGLVQFLRQSPYEKDYDGFRLQARQSRENAMNWARKKGRTINYERLFGDGPMPPFFSGKCYFLSRKFAKFISERADGTAQEYAEYLIGAEDVMVGRLFQDFKSSVGQ